MAEPELQAQANAVVDQIMAGDFSSLAALDGAEGEAFEAAVESMRAQVRSGVEEARNLVGAQGGNNAANGEVVNLAYEVQTPDGFTIISQTYTQAEGESPTLSAINVAGSDKSLAAQMRRLKSAGKLVGGALLISFILIFMIMFRRKPVPDAA
jgi:hypothetical protein